MSVVISTGRRRKVTLYAAGLLLLATMLSPIYVPYFLWAQKAPMTRPMLVYKGSRFNVPVVIENDEPYVPVEFIRTQIDKEIFWDTKGILVVTTQDKVVKLKTQSLTAYVNQHPVTLKFPVVMEGSEPYVPAVTLESLYPLRCEYVPEEGVFRISRLDEPVKVGSISNSTYMRLEPKILSRRAAALEEGNEVLLFEKVGQWYKAETMKGVPGYVRVSDIAKVREVEAVLTQQPSYTPSPLKGSRISLVWEQVDAKTPDPATIGEMPGINVVSPTWFHLSKEPGELENRADMRYVSWAHANGYQVWALFSNSFDPDLTRTVLRDSDLRDKVIAQILMYARVYQLDGINIDFENIYQEDAPFLTQFVRELTPLLHQQGLTVSVDVTVKSSSPMWSLCYERNRLAQVVDYVMLMAYDQYYAGSPVAGPTAAIPWTEESIKKTLEEVPAQKLVLGVPFYTRVWEESSSGGISKVTQKAIGMKSIPDWLERNQVVSVFDQETGLRYAEKRTEEGKLRIWIEDEASLQKRLELAEKYGLAGIAAWRRGFEEKSVYKVIEAFSR